jgi:hypothetical protein
MREKKSTGYARRPENIIMDMNKLKLQQISDWQPGKRGSADIFHRGDHNHDNGYDNAGQVRVEAR